MVWICRMRSTFIAEFLTHARYAYETNDGITLVPCVTA